MNDLDQTQLPDELTQLKERATKLGIKFHPSIGLDALKEKVNDLLTGKEEKETPVETKALVETQGQMRSRLRKEAQKQVRIRVTCMNPNKKDWPGEIFSFSNSVLGSVKKYVPFNAEEGWHVPVCILNMIKERKFQTFYKVKENGKEITRGKQVPEFSVEILPNLSKEELETLAKVQAMKSGQ